MKYGKKAGSDEQHEYAPYWFRIAEVILGIASVAVAVIALANLKDGTEQLVLLLSLSISFSAIRMVARGSLKRNLMSFEALGLAGGGLLALAIVLLVAFSGLSPLTLVFLLAVSLTIQGLGRILHAAARGLPRWLRGSAIATGVITVIIAGFVLFVQGVAVLTLAALLSVVVLVGGIESIVSGLHPTNRQQMTLLKLVLFASFYGLVLINWIDLFATTAPAYHVWLVLTYMAPFGVLIVFQGFKDWQLALSLGLLVSLTNDVGYYFVGDLLFGKQQALLPWLAGQLGFEGNTLLFTFQGGVFSIPVTSYLMGASIYARAIVVSAVLYNWWRSSWKLERKI